LSLVASYIRVLVYVFGLLLVVFGSLGFLSEIYSSKSLRYIRINPLNIVLRRLGGRGIYFSSVAIGFLGGLASLSCPCSLPLLPAIYSYIISSEMHSSIYVALLFSFSATLPSLLILSLLIYRKIFDLVYDYARIYMDVIKAVILLSLAVLGIIMIIVF